MIAEWYQPHRPTSLDCLGLLYRVYLGGSLALDWLKAWSDEKHIYIYIHLWDFIYFCGTSATDLDDWKQLRWKHFPYDLMIFHGPWCELTAGFKFSFKLEGSTAHSDNMITENRESNLLSLLKSPRSCSENCHFKRQIIINGAYFSLVTCPNHWYIVW